jgi:3-methyladenine DNA glycosylase AlkD
MEKKELVRLIKKRLRAAADPAKAGPMAAYLKTDMPFYGVQKGERIPIYREMKKRFAPATRKEYEEVVLALWGLPHREEKYTAIEYANQSKKYITPGSLSLFERLIREGAWWDLVDGVAIHMVGQILLHNREKIRPVMEAWVEDEDMWIRRTALIAHIGHKEETDEAQLFDHCLRRSSEKEFFIRKAIGWTLREYSYTAPSAVKDFLISNRETLSGLSFREGSKQLVRAGFLPSRSK